MLAREAIGADVVAYVPAGVSPFKRGETGTSAHHRLRMLELALQDVDQAVIVTDELDRARDDEASYTVETLERLHDRLREGTRMRLLIGADQLRRFDRWRSPERIIESAEPVVMLRPPDTRDSLLAELPAGYDKHVWGTRIVELPVMDISSTMVRQRVAAGKGIDELVPAGVARYIRENQLYGCALDR